MRNAFYNAASGLEGTQYNITLAYAIGDVASLTLVTSSLSGVGINATVSEVGFTCIGTPHLPPLFADTI